jgi:hypothetical protein
MMNNKEDWKKKLSDVLESCQGELRKTTEIGRKMLVASRRNSELKEAYEMLGLMALKDVRSEQLNWSNDKAQELIAKIDKYEEELENIEDDVQNIKSENKNES